ncbi:MAG: hypothetical protein PHR10_03715 [Sphaerochaetaceae bacterium]|jgi:glutathione synthase/RimK-type ligase-like ATP-grasp enzyme|nr:hypothetical protein [Sphaerochaetaceae bacterium]
MLDVYKQILDHNDIPYIDLDINDPGFWNDVKRIDVFMAKIAQTDDDLALAAQIIPVINKFLGVRCFPDYNTVWHYDDKVKQYYLLHSMGYPVIESYIFWDRAKALEWATRTNYPVIFKLKGGAGSVNVKKITKFKQAKGLIEKAFSSGIHPHYFDLPNKFKAFNYDTTKIAKYLTKPFYRRLLLGISGYSNYTRHKNYVYFQKYLPDNAWDTRVTIVGSRAFAFRRFVRKNDFRASGSNHYDMSREKIDMRFVEIGFAISQKLGFQSMAYDFIYDENHEPSLIEMSYTYGDYPEFSTGYWDLQLKWHDGSYIPEYLELVDALNMPDIKQPHIDLDSPYKNAKM